MKTHAAKIDGLQHTANKRSVGFVRYYRRGQKQPFLRSLSGCILALGQFQIGRRGESCLLFEHLHKVRSRLKANAVGDAFDGKAAVGLGVVHPSASLFDAVVVEQGGKALAGLFVDDL